MSDNSPGSDPIYRRLYAFPVMVADLLRSVLPAAAFDALDIRTLDKVPASYVGDDYRQRHGDTVWRVYAAGRGPTCWCCLDSNRAAMRRWRCG